MRESAAVKIRRMADLHPLIAAFAVAWAAQMAGLLLFNFGTDAAGQQLQVSPLNSLMLAVPLYSCWILLIAAAWLALWRAVAPARWFVTATGVTTAFALILITQVDFGMQRFRGERLSLVHFRTYLTPSVMDGDWLTPVADDPKYLAMTLGICLGAWLALTVLLLARARRRSSEPPRVPTWRGVARCAAGAAICYAPLMFAWYHQRDMVLPPEIVLARAALFPVRALTPAKEAAERSALRRELDPGGTSRWVSDEYPLMRAPAPDRAPAARGAGAAAARDTTSPDIIFFVVESLRGHDVGYGLSPRARGQSVTPHLDSLAAESVVFPHYIASGEPSPRGFITINTGEWEHGSAFIIANYPNVHIDAIPARLRARGYHTMALWGGNPSFDNQLTWARRWYDERVFKLPEDRLFYFKTTPDHVLMDRVIERVQAHDRAAPGQPFFAYVASNGTHTPYTLEDSAAVPGDSVASMSRQRRYDLCLENIDAQIGRVVAFLKTRPRWKNTVIVVIGDHSDRTDEVLDARWRGMPVDPAVYTAALIHGPARLIGAPRRDDIAASHVDLLPTVLDWIGDHGVYSSPGQDLFAPIPESQRRAVSINSRGYRLDRAGFTLLVDSHDPAIHYAYKSFPAGEPQLLPLAQTPFAPDEPARLTAEIRYWSQLVEQNRVWNDSLASSARTSP
ncbi:MAG: LTA synthase family protein [Gemmatimonadales bacterium]